MAKTPKRPRDPNQLAKLITDIATGEPAEALQDRSGGATQLGSSGGIARARNLTAAEREAIAKKAAAARWKQKSPAAQDEKEKS